MVRLLAKNLGVPTPVMPDNKNNTGVGSMLSMPPLVPKLTHFPNPEGFVR